jgi:hypothetical protein
MGDEMPPSAEYPESISPPGLFRIDDRGWAIFVAYTQNNLTLDEVGRAFGVPAYRVRRIVRQVEIEMVRMGQPQSGSLKLESDIERLGLPVRTRNALRGIDCKTIGDLLTLDLSAPVRGLGAKSKDTLLQCLRQNGFAHPSSEGHPLSEIRLMERSLERIQRRVDRALTSVAKEIAALKQRLHKRVRGPHHGAPQLR